VDRLPALAKELVDARVGVVLAINTPGACAAIQAAKQIRIVMTIVGDPAGKFTPLGKRGMFTKSFQEALTWRRS
jgi:ABC-type uncharacterized transport system substrate-binding protein